MSAEAVWNGIRDRGGAPLDIVSRDFLAAVEPQPTGITGLDAILGGGLRPGVTILGGEPGAGKSALALQVCLNVAASDAGGAGNRPVLFVSAELPKSQCLFRLYSLLSKTSAGLLPFKWSDVPGLARYAREDYEEAKKLGATLEEFAAVSQNVALRTHRHFEEVCWSLAVADDIPAVEELEGVVGKLARCGLSPLVAVDYLQALGIGGMQNLGEYEKVTAISKRLAAMAKEHGIPLLVLSSLSRTGSQEPGLHSFKGSGQLEYDAVAALVLSCDPNQDEDTLRTLRADRDGYSRDVSLAVVKNRFGSLGSLKLGFYGGYNMFQEYK